MASMLSATEIVRDNDDGTITPVAGATIKVHKVADGALLTTLVADAGGFVAATSLDVSAGTLVRASVSLGNGVCGYAEETTT